MFSAQEVVWGEPGVNPRRRFDAPPRTLPHLARTSNPSIESKLATNRKTQKNAGKRMVFGLGAGGQRDATPALLDAQVLTYAHVRSEFSNPGEPVSKKPCGVWRRTTR